MLRLVVCFVFLALSVSAHANSVQGHGATSCAKFGELYRKLPDEAERTYFYWAQGYMSGINMAVIANGKPPRNLAGDYQSQQRKIRDYCANNPLKDYMDAVLNLFTSLPFENSN